MIGLSMSCGLEIRFRKFVAKRKLLSEQLVRYFLTAWECSQVLCSHPPLHRSADLQPG